jgi:hypothetical protein
VPALREQLQQFVQQLSDEAPVDHQQLLVWWPACKARLQLECMRLAKAARAEQQPSVAQQRDAAAAALAAAYDAVERGGQPAQLQAVLQQVSQARQQWCEQVAAHAEAANWVQRRSFVHVGERPNPVFTSRIRSKASREELVVPAMQHPITGAEVRGGKPLAQLVADFWAGVSKEPEIDAAAEQEVLAAVQAANLSMSEVVVAAVGAREVTQAEVHKALKHSAPGKAPGLDGLPVELYRRCKDVFVPLLARLYTAIGVTGCVPAGFTEGVIVTIYKSGPRSGTGNYRPITLLGTDYRLLAKILASRLSQVLGGVIGLEHGAFLPGRQIADNNRLLQLLPHALPVDSEAMVAFLDFRKAYDTVSRAFLFKLLQLAGLGGDFLVWVQLLLHDTRSRACVNGYVSNPAPFKAGVRQGCPLAPLLYLLVGQALLLYLKSKQVGVQVGGAPHHSKSVCRRHTCVLAVASAATHPVAGSCGV